MDNIEAIRELSYKLLEIESPMIIVKRIYILPWTEGSEFGYKLAEADHS